MGWIAVYSSDENGQTWQFLSKAAETGDHSGNPPSMVRLADGRIVLAYAYRSKPHGVRAVISSDEGKTWSDVIHLRDDGRTWDIGYTRTIQRLDGKLVTAYYYTTEVNRQQHIAATIWDPDRVR
jgi:Neuraminidase (sialidase)